MQCAFALLGAKGEAEHAFSVEFLYDDTDYRTAVKVTRTSAAPIRFSPLVGYQRHSSYSDGYGRPVYRIGDSGWYAKFRTA